MNLKRATLEQLQALMDELEKNPDLARGRLGGSNAHERSQAMWRHIALKLNSMGGSVKTPEKWKKYWSDKKNSVKHAAASARKSANKTGGGPPDPPSFNPIDERVISLMGKGFGSGLHGVSVPLFPSLSTPEVSVATPLDRPVENVVTVPLEIENIPPMVSDDPAQFLDEQPLPPLIEFVDEPALPPPPLLVEPQLVNNDQQQGPEIAQLPLIDAQANGRRHIPAGSYSALREQFVEIEQQRVEAELIQARSTAELVPVLLSMAASLQQIAASMQRTEQALLGILERMDGPT